MLMYLEHPEVEINALAPPALLEDTLCLTLELHPSGTRNTVPPAGSLVPNMTSGKMPQTLVVSSDELRSQL